MIVVRVTPDQCVERRDSRGTQERHNDTPAGVDAVVETRPRIVDERMARGSHENREALANVQHDDPHAAGKGPSCG